MKIGRCLIALWILLNVATVCNSINDDNEEVSNNPTEETDNDGESDESIAGNDLPPHEFKFKLRTTKKGKNAGEKSL